jgi:hypothetical protein
MYIHPNWPEALKDPIVRHPVIIGCYGFGFVLGQVMPVNVLDSYPLVAWVCTHMTQWIPSIDSWSEYSAFPQPTKALFTYFWLAAPVLTVTIIRATAKDVE